MSNNAEETHNENSTLYEQHLIEGTPFKLIRIEDKWFMVMGNARITEPTTTKEEQIEKLEKEKWLIIINVIAIITEKLYKPFKNNWNNIDYDGIPATDKVTDNNSL